MSICALVAGEFPPTVTPAFPKTLSIAEAADVAALPNTLVTPFRAPFVFAFNWPKAPLTFPKSSCPIDDPPGPTPLGNPLSNCFSAA